MTRIIAGMAGGMNLASVPGDGTRPTTDRAKEALFSWLSARGWLDGTAVLDLFAGSGALGAEAASRGATRVELVENHRKAVLVCRKNASAVNRRAGTEIITVRPTTVDTMLADTPPKSWDLILADPPYPLTGTALRRSLDLMTAALKPDGLMVLERSQRSPEPEWPAGLELLESRRYGETQLYFLIPYHDDGADPQK